MLPLTLQRPSLTAPEAKRRLRNAYRSARRLPSGLLFLLFTLVPGLCFVMLHTLGYDPSLSKLLLVQMLVISSITDLLWKRISNRLLLASLFGVAILSLLNAPETPGISQSLLGFFGCFAMALTTYLLLRGGEGDVKLLAVIGAFLGFDHGIEAWVFGYLLAFPIALGATLLHRDRKRFTLPMAPFLALGTVLTRIG